MARFQMCRHNPGIYQVYTRLRNCRLGKDILGISQSYSFYLKKRGTGIYQVYTWDMKMVVI
jgi:hypothetical protein